MIDGVSHLGVQSPLTEYMFISLPEGALDFKQDIGASGITWSSKRLTLMQNCIQISGALDFKQDTERVASLGVQSAGITYTSISLCLSALDFKQYIGASGITWSSKRLDNIHIHLFMSERFGLTCRISERVASLGVQRAWITYTSISLCLSTLDFKQHIGGVIPPSVYWLKSKRPANSLPCIALSWPLELQRGHLEFKALG